MLSISHLLQIGGKPRHRCCPNGPPQMSHVNSFVSVAILLPSGVADLAYKMGRQDLFGEWTNLHESSGGLRDHVVTVPEHSAYIGNSFTFAEDARFHEE